MKSERRHELQHNDLAEWAIKIYQHVAPYRNAILGVVLLLIVAGITWTIWHGHSQGQAAEGWNAIGLPGVQADINRLEKASSEYKGMPAGEWAQVLAADTFLSASENQLKEHKDVANQYFNFALERYEKTLAASPDYMARERAMFGKARILESLGKLPEATAAYTDLNKAFPEGTYKAIADQRIEQLAKPEIAEFYKALAQYTPPPKKEAEKPAASPRSKLENIAPLPENPEQPPMPKPGDSSSGTAASSPKTSANSVQPKIEIPKSSAATPLGTAAPDASKTAPAKKDK
jgi:hypothetical protein